MTMLHSEFYIGLEFWCGDRQWRCTDTGTRVVVAIRIDEVTVVVRHGNSSEEVILDHRLAENQGWFNGPPYAVAETVFDETSLEACSREKDNG
jgi:hypothetical protein